MTRPVAVAVPVSALMVLGFVVVMQPLGEHRVFVGQHPPPSSVRHWKYEGKHVGSAVHDPPHSNSISFELQQYMLEGVRAVEWHAILTGQQISWGLVSFNIWQLCVQ